MVNILGVVIITGLVTIFGGGIGFFLWMKTRPKKITWNAKVYHLSEGIKEFKVDEKGVVKSKIRLKDLIPYAKDVLEKVEKDKGITLYRLKKLNIPTPEVEGDVVEYWGEGNKEVNVVIHKGSATLLRKGYDEEHAAMVFDPMPHDRINILKSEMAIKKDRIRKEKDILEAITPWIVAGICMMGLIAIGYVMIDGYITVSENMQTGIAAMNAMHEREVNCADFSQGIIPQTQPVGQQPTTDNDDWVVEDNG